MTEKITHLACKNLSARYSPAGPFISRNINFEVNAGEIMAIMGPSGAGKSTLLKAVLGQIPHIQGRIYANGQDITDTGLSCVKGQVALVPQDDVLVDELTVRENIASYHAIAVDSPLSSKEVDAAINHHLAALGIAKVADSRVGSSDGSKKNISGGQRKRANIVMELVNDPDVLIIDEPTSGLSSQDSLELAQNLRQIADSGKIVIIIIHQPGSAIFQLFDRLLILDGHGHCVRSGKREDVVQWFERAGLLQGKPSCDCCKSQFPDLLLAAVERRGNWEAASQGFATEFEHLPLPEPTPLSKTRWLRSPIESAKDFLTLVKRQLLIKKRDRMSQLITLLAPPLLGLLMASVFKSTPEGAQYRFENNALYSHFIFMLIVSGMFLGLVSSIFEVLKDRAMLGREALRGLSVTAYYFSELTTLAVVSAVQALLLTACALWILSASHLFWPNFEVLYLVMLISNAMGLLISMLFNSAIAAYNMVPILLIPQIILGGALLPYKDMGSEVYLWQARDASHQPALAKLMPASWAYEMAIRLNHDHVSREGGPMNMALKAVEPIRQGGFLALRDETTPSQKTLSWVGMESAHNKGYATDALVLVLFFGFFTASGLVWIRRDYGRQRAGKVFVFWQSGAALASVLAFSLLTEAAIPEVRAEPEKPVVPPTVQGKPTRAGKAPDKAAKASADKLGIGMLPGRWQVKCLGARCDDTWTFLPGNRVANSSGIEGLWVVEHSKRGDLLKVKWVDGPWASFRLPVNPVLMSGRQQANKKINMTRLGG